MANIVARDVADSVAGMVAEHIAVFIAEMWRLRWLMVVGWREGVSGIADFVAGMLAVFAGNLAGDVADCETAFASADFFRVCGCWRRRSGGYEKARDIAGFAAFSDRVANCVAMVAMLAATTSIFAGAPDVTSGSFFRQRRGRTAMIVAGGVADVAGHNG